MRKTKQGEKPRETPPVEPVLETALVPSSGAGGLWTDPPKDWRKRFEELPGPAVDAIASALAVRGEFADVYKAAGIAQAHLKGVGIYAGDNTSTNVTVLIQQINTLPPDLRECYLSNDDALLSDGDTIDVSPNDTVALRGVADKDG